MARYLICYDIASPKRLGKVHRYIVKHAVFIQLSVYYLEGDKKDLARLLSDLTLIIDIRFDDVRAYAIKSLEDAVQIGTPWLPEGIDTYSHS